MVADLIRRHPLWLAATFGTLVGVVIGLFLPIRAPAAEAAHADEWALPAPAAARGYSDASAATIRTARFWGADANANKRAPKQEWLLRAIVTRPSTRVAIAVGPGKDMVWVALGERMPDGSVLVAVNRDTAWTDRDGCRSPHSLYPSANAVDPCLQDGTARAANPPGNAPARTPSKTGSP